MRFLKFILTFILILSAFAGDNLVFKSKYSDSIVFRAVTDTLVHGFIGLLSAALFFSHKLNFSTQTCLLNTLFCTVMSSIIDLDHVFVAKSFHFKVSCPYSWVFRISLCKAINLAHILFDIWPIWRVIPGFRVCIWQSTSPTLIASRSCRARQLFGIYIIGLIELIECWSAFLLMIGSFLPTRWSCLDCFKEISIALRTGLRIGLLLLFGLLMVLR